ncbi:MAG: DUF374 domain-containing protein [Deltaproteobacteria bacterium]|nr:MAG: DUF374 domain-containing protein [Deltaproteobacteria bacterium]
MPGLGDRILLTCLPWLAAGLVRTLAVTLRREIVGEEPVRALWLAGRPAILVYWHDQLMMMPFGYRGPGAKGLISASRDGEYLARTMAHLGVGAVRGSSNRGGRAAFREMLALAAEPVDLAITPDGPKGPRHEAKDGVVQLARLSGRPVVPMAFVCSRGHRFASWDRFLLPYPFGRAVYAYGAPLYYDQAESVEQFRLRVQEAIEATGRRAAEQLKAYDLSAV